MSVDGIKDSRVWVEDACGFNVLGEIMQADFPEVLDYTYMRLAEKAVFSSGNSHFREDKVAGRKRENTSLALLIIWL